MLGRVEYYHKLRRLSHRAHGFPPAFVALGLVLHRSWAHIHSRGGRRHEARLAAMNIIEVRNLTRTFGEVKAVDDVSFDVAEGEIFAFLGPNGAGKSTTIKMLTTLLKPTSGTIRVNGFDPVTDPDAVRHSFGIVFQDPA